MGDNEILNQTDNDYMSNGQIELNLQGEEKIDEGDLAISAFINEKVRKFKTEVKDFLSEKGYQSHMKVEVAFGKENE